MHLRPISCSAWLAALTYAGIAWADLPFQDDGQAVLGGEPTGSSPAKKPKNVVFVLTDDQDAAMDSVSYMPLLQKHLSAKGTTYSNHFTTTAICCPSRVSLWTGKQPHNTNVTDVHPPYGGYPKFVSQGLNENYLPVWLQEAGYNTYYTGKLFNAHTIWNYDSPCPAAWTSTDFLLDPGTYSYLHPIYQANQDAPVHHRNEHTSDLITAKAQGLLREAISSDKPFFLGVAPVAPHSDVSLDRDSSSLPHMTEPIPAERHAGLFKDVKIPRTDNFNPDSPSGASWVRKLAQQNASAVEYLDHYYRQRLRALQAVDELVEKLVAQLEDAGVLDDTYIIFSSDNGFHLGQHRLPPGKECGYEEDIRVPLIIRGPRVPEGSVEDAVTTHIDLAPTILKITGSKSRPDFDGTPIPLGVGDAVETGEEGFFSETRRHEHVAVEYWGFALAEGEGGGFDGEGQIVVQNNTYKAVRVIGQGYNLYYSVWCNNEHELYNLETDPGQLHNLYSSKSSDEDIKLLGTDISLVISRLDALMMVLKSCKGGTCIEPWKVLHPRGDVHSLSDALQVRFDSFYRHQAKVAYDRCELGYIIDAEGPQEPYQYRKGWNWHSWV
ncbi:alkaline-phosphatase-like protein [Diaporthe sp. PMI_573]|nr:alkaline-phosphatase-like protein [Diaporthaceae sp. PMI_573]